MHINIYINIIILVRIFEAFSLLISSYSIIITDENGA